MLHLDQNPYVGIRSFKPSESHLFFGRESLIRNLSDKLAGERFVAVVGVSGSGKSSLVKAGLIPSLLRDSNWEVAVIRPESNPLGNLEAELSNVFQDKLNEEEIRFNLDYNSQGISDCYEDSGLESSLLIVVDQFEEIFRYKSQGLEKKEKAIRFINLLIECSNHENELPIHVIITMRSEFLGECAEFKGLPEKINDGQFLVPRLTRRQYRDAIAKPVEVTGGVISEALMSQLLNDIEDDPDQLPIMQHALMRTWQNWREVSAPDLLSMANYESAGGMQKALSKHCTKIYEEIGQQHPELQYCTRLIFQRLTELKNDGVGIRNPTDMRDLKLVSGCTYSQVRFVVNKFSTNGVNVLTFGGEEELSDSTVIDISHESLMRKWELLTDHWIPEENESKQKLLSIEDSIAQGDLLQKNSLQRYLEWDKYKEYKTNETKVINWAKRYKVNFEVVHQFILESKKQLRLHLLTTRFIPALLVLLFIALMIFQQFRIVNEQRKVAVERQNRLSQDSSRQVQNRAKFLELDSMCESRLRIIEEIQALKLSEKAETAEIERRFNETALVRDSLRIRLLKLQSESNRLKNTLFAERRKLDDAQKSYVTEKATLEDSISNLLSKIEEIVSTPDPATSLAFEGYKLIVHFNTSRGTARGLVDTFKSQGISAMSREEDFINENRRFLLDFDGDQEELTDLVYSILRPMINRTLKSLDYTIHKNSPYYAKWKNRDRNRNENEIHIYLR